MWRWHLLDREMGSCLICTLVRLLVRISGLIRRTEMLAYWPVLSLSFHLSMLREDSQRHQICERYVNKVQFGLLLAVDSFDQES